jgi:hypothetical protein
MQIHSQYTNSCPICGKLRHYKSKSGFHRANSKQLACKSCSNSIQAGGKGHLIKGDQKLCSFCHQYKSFDKFGTNGNGKLKSRCKDCQTKYNTQYHKEVFRFDRYGITKEAFTQMLDNQNHSCAICEIGINEKSSHIDHCHSTGKVRGVLCEKCNKGLGQFDDNVNYLSNAIKYLNK